MILEAAGIGALAGLAKSALDERKAARDREIQSAVARYSPWTGMKPTIPENPDYFGNMLQGGLQGASFGQGVQNFEQGQTNQQKMNTFLDSQTELNKSKAAALQNQDQWNALAANGQVSPYAMMLAQQGYA